MLTHKFVSLSAYAQTSIRQSLGPLGEVQGDIPHQHHGTINITTDLLGTDRDAPGLLRELDLLLPKVCEGLILVAQCLTTIALQAQETNTFSALPSQPPADSACPSKPSSVIATPAFLEQGFVESHIGG